MLLTSVQISGELLRMGFLQCDEVQGSSCGTPSVVCGNSRDVVSFSRTMSQRHWEQIVGQNQCVGRRPHFEITCCQHKYIGLVAQEMHSGQNKEVQTLNKEKKIVSLASQKNYIGYRFESFFPKSWQPKTYNEYLLVNSLIEEITRCYCILL